VSLLSLAEQAPPNENTLFVTEFYSGFCNTFKRITLHCQGDDNGARATQLANEGAWQAKRLNEAKKKQQSARANRRGAKKVEQKNFLPFEVETL